MDCRTFHQKLDDYLEDGLDFSGRFGIERHAQQCIRCGKALADAQHLRQMVQGLQRVKAPANFETSVLKEIARQKANERFWNIRKYWICGFEWPSWRKLAIASSGLAVLGLIIFYASHRTNTERVSAPVPVAAEPAKIFIEAKEANRPVNKVETPLKKEPLLAETRKAKPKDLPSPVAVEPVLVDDRDAVEPGYVEYTIGEPAEHAVPLRLPKKIPLRYNPISEEYFILNVSH
ncbi:MAG: hypothetical protein JXA73_06090 [Acidobacteria bacterium]|nr:hypothetical protein [Acidobacteriota bacterium]